MSSKPVRIVNCSFFTARCNAGYIFFPSGSTSSSTFVRPGVNFINIYARVFRTKFWCQSRNVTRKAAKKDVRTKKRTKKCWWNWRLVALVHTLFAVIGLIVRKEERYSLVWWCKHAKSITSHRTRFSVFKKLDHSVNQIFYVTTHQLNEISYFRTWSQRCLLSSRQFRIEQRHQEQQTRMEDCRRRQRIGPRMRRRWDFGLRPCILNF